MVRTELLRRSETSSYCNYKGYATYWSAVLGDAVVEDVAWSYEDPLPETSPISRVFQLRRRARRPRRRAPGRNQAVSGSW